MGLFKPNVAKLSAQEDIDGLLAALRHRDEKVRTDAALALGEIRDARAVEPLIGALGDQSHKVRQSAGKALGAIGEPALRPLIAHLQARPDLSLAADRAFKEIGPEPLKAQLQGLDPTSHWRGLEVLMAMGDVWAQEQLITILMDDSVDAGTLIDIARMLVMRSSLTWGEGDPMGMRAKEGVATFRRRKAAIPFLIYEFTHALKETGVLRAGEALAEFGAEGLEPLLEALGDDSILARYRAVAPMSDDEAKLLMVELTIRHMREIEERELKRRQERKEMLGSIERMLEPPP